MSQLLVRKIPESLVKKLKRRAVEHGVSAEEEHRRILKEALLHTEEKSAKPYSLFDHIRKLGEIAPDLAFGRKRSRGKRRVVKL
jgi:plasmid stability protein